MPLKMSFNVLIFIVYLLSGESKGGEINLPEEYLVFAERGGVFAASIEDGKPVVKEIFSMGKKTPRIGVSSNHEALWILNDEEIEAEFDLVKMGLKTRFLDEEVMSSIDGYWIALSPDGQTLAYAARDKAGLSLCLKNLDTGKVQKLSSGWEVLKAPSSSPDGRMIAFYCSKDIAVHSEGGLRLHVVDTSGRKDREIGAPSRLLRYGGESRYPVVWSTKSDAVYFEACYNGEEWGSSVYTANIDGKDNPTRVTGGICTSIRGQDNTLLVVDGGIYAVTLEQGTWRRNLVQEWPASFPKISPSGKVLAYKKRSGLYCKIMDDGPELLIDKDYRSDFLGFYWVKAIGPDAKDEHK